MDMNGLYAWAVSPMRYIPYVFWILSLVVIVPACFGRELGIRRWYISVLMRLFNWATRRLAKDDNDQNRKFMTSSTEDIISRENSINKLGSLKDIVQANQNFKLDDVTFLIKSGIEAVIDDEVTKRFRAEELPSWNLLTRTNYHYHFISSGSALGPQRVRLSVLWFLGVILRYLFLFPLRVLMTLSGMTWMLVTMIPLSVMPDSKIKRKIVYFTNLVSFRICCRAFSAVVNYHDRENMPNSSGICVANHTTTLDVCLLMQDRPYAILGQIHGGFLGWFERTLSKCTNHVWFERSEVRDRQFVVRRVREHLDDPKNFPILLFPEGTCINNTSVMMFKKGTFEIPATIYPVAIKYNPWFGDAFWNSSKHSMLQYLAVVMTSWAIVADVWYLPPMNRQPDEDALHFADRVKSVIARRGGLVDCVWDGQLKRMRVKESYKKEKQKEISDILIKSHVDENCTGDIEPSFSVADDKIKVSKALELNKLNDDQKSSISAQETTNDGLKNSEVTPNGIETN